MLLQKYFQTKFDDALKTKLLPITALLTAQVFTEQFFDSVILQSKEKHTFRDNKRDTR